MSFEGFPHIVGWELTLVCNLLCRHCASAAGQPRDNELSLDEALSLCDQFPPLAVREVHFTGGEPLLRPDWWRIAEYVAAKGIKTRIVTNGLPLVASTIARIQDVGIDTVGISVDGLEETHDDIRALPGLWHRVIAAIERATEAGLRVGVITAVNAINLAELPALHSLLRSLGVRSWQLQPNLPLGRGGESTDLHLAPADYVRLGAFFRAVRESTDDELQVVPADSLGYFTELDLEQPPWWGCPAGLYAVGIQSDGKVKGCLTLPDAMIEGDLREDDLWDIWFRPGAFAYTREFREDEMGPYCRECELAAQCKGGCSSMSYVCTGAFHNDPYCFRGIRHRQPEVFERAATAGLRGFEPRPQAPRALRTGSRSCAFRF